ncbi:MAG: MATE family efflux transporter [Bacteroidetes bacterium]|nr:MAG: MATE family efflux transporter [Bacteroidota bacterium]
MNNSPSPASLTEGPIGSTLIKLTMPMLFGIMGMVVFNLVDTIYIGRLGTAELAALSFTFPVVMVVTSIGLGIGVGASSLISFAIGEGNHTKVQRITSDSLVLSLFLVTIFISIGYFTIDPLFTALGASPEILILIHEYMEIWYLGVPFVVVPMVGNNALRAKGDMKTPAKIMLAIVVVNIILDPLLIFGLGPFPEMGLKGAAIATVFARALSLFVGLYVLHYRDNMLTFKSPGITEVFISWKNLLSIALPAAGARMVVPVAIGVVTRLISQYGHAPVAAYGAASRAEFFMLATLMALSSVLNPFVGQNIGAKKVDRAKEALNKGLRFALLWGIGSFLLLQLIAKPVAMLFSTEPEVIEYIALYLHIVPVGYALRGVFDIVANVLYVLRKPLLSAGLILMQMIFLIVPLIYIGSHFYGIKGIFIGLVVANIIAGSIGYLVLKHQLKNPITGA